MIERITKLILENIEKDFIIEPNTNLRSELDIDSFDFLMIINALEDEFCIEIEEDDFEKANSVKDIVSLLENKYGER